jgi:hypothetical protein
MADVVTDINFSGLNAAATAFGFLKNTDNKILMLNGYPLEIFAYVTDGDGSTNAEFPCNRITRVIDGFVYNVTDDAFEAFPVTPKAGTPSTGVATGAFGNSKTYVVGVLGVET